MFRYLRYCGACQGFSHSRADFVTFIHRRSGIHQPCIDDFDEAAEQFRFDLRGLVLRIPGKQPAQLAIMLAAEFPVAKGSFQMHSSFPCQGGLSIFAEIGGLGQEESDQFIRQLFNMRRA